MVTGIIIGPPHCFSPGDCIHREPSSYLALHCILQYFSPFSSVDLHRMAAAFNTAVPSLEDELTQLILDGQISARIDSNAKVNWNSRTQAIPVTVSETFA